MDTIVRWYSSSSLARKSKVARKTSGDKLAHRLSSRSMSSATFLFLVIVSMGYLVDFRFIFCPHVGYIDPYVVILLSAKWSIVKNIFLLRLTTYLMIGRPAAIVVHHFGSRDSRRSCRLWRIEGRPVFSIHESTPFRSVIFPYSYRGCVLHIKDAFFRFVTFFTLMKRHPFRFANATRIIKFLRFEGSVAFRTFFVRSRFAGFRQIHLFFRCSRADSKLFFFDRR